MEHTTAVLIGLGVGILQGVVILMIKQLFHQINKICSDNEKDHKEMWRRVNHHSHTEKGKVIIEEML